jgi:aspartate aminotransferase
MFTYVGLSESQVFAIRERHHVYMLKSGRISISGCEYSYRATSSCSKEILLDSNILADNDLVNESNVRYVAMAIDDVVRSVS